MQGQKLHTLNTFINQFVAFALQMWDSRYLLKLQKIKHNNRLNCIVHRKKDEFGFLFLISPWYLVCCM